MSLKVECLHRLGSLLRPYLATHIPWTNTYGLGRSIIAFATLLTLAINSAHVLFHAGADASDEASCSALARSISLFCLLPHNLDLARVVACVFLVPTVAGYRPRFTGIIHWWISYSLFTSGKVTDGGDEVASLVTFLLLPLTLTDGRVWHWSEIGLTQSLISRLIGISSYIVVQVQVAYIYLDACLEKLRIPEWQDGTNLYYILSGNYFGAPAYLRSMTSHIITSPAIVLFTWMVLALEFCLGINIVMATRYRLVLLVLAIMFHVLIGVTLGISSFAITMIGALLIGLVPVGWSVSDLKARRDRGPIFAT